MKNRFLSIISLLMFLTACAPQLASEPTKVQVKANIATTVNQTATVVSQATLVPTDIPIAPTQVPQTASEKKLTEECITLEQEMPNDLPLSGAWIINDGMPYLENIADHMAYRIPLKGGSYFSAADGDMAISPDGKSIAYIDQYLNDIYKYRTEKRILRVVRSTGYALHMEYWQNMETWQWIIGWLDNQNLILATGHKDVLILNPFTGERQVFKQPEWVNSKSNTNYWYASRYPLYNSTLEWILEHPSYEELELKSVQTGETIWQSERSEWPDWSWSTNGSTLAISLNGSISLFRNGKTDAKYDMNGLGYSYLSRQKFSPDGQKLAFNSSKNYINQPTILNLSQTKLARLCADDYETWSSPIWSPDSRFVIEDVHDSHYQSFDILIDTQTLHAYLLKSGYAHHRIAWLAQP